MNTNIIQLEKPYNIILAEHQVHRHVATLIVAVSINQSNELKTLSYPVFEDGMVCIRPLGCTIVLSKDNHPISLQSLSLLIMEFTTIYPLARLCDLFHDLQSIGAKVEIPSKEEYIFELSVRQSEHKSIVQHDSDFPFIQVCSTPGCTINQLLEAASNQIIDLLEYFGNAIRIKVQMKDQTHEQYINQRIQAV